MKKSKAYNSQDFTNLKYKPKKTDLVVQYKISPARGYKFQDVASIIAGESSVGTWTDVNTMNQKIAEKLSPKVFYLDKKNKRARIAYPLELFELGNLPEIMSSIGGNIFGMSSVKGLFLEDIQIPKKMLKSFSGPAFGIKGVRKMLKIKKRPLVGTIVKPKVGLNPNEHARTAYFAWKGGCDIVKDDENLTSQDFNKFRERFIKTISLMKRAEKETGERKAYLVNCTAETEEMLRRIKFVQEHGGNYIMLDILTLGWGALQTARLFAKIPIHAHRAGHAMFDRNENGKTFGMSMEVIAQLARMIGVDTLHIGAIYGKMSGEKDKVLHIEKEIESEFTRKTKEYLDQKWYRVKPVLGVASGGIHPGIIPKIIQAMGNNIVIQAGGGVHGHPGGTEAGARAIRQAVDAVLKKISLNEYAKTHSELREALEKWGR